MIRLHRIVRLALVAAALAGGLSFAVPHAAAQNGYFAGIAYSQSTGKIGYTARQARSEQQAQQLAVANCGVADAKAFIWGLNEWVAIAVVDGKVGTAGFARDRNVDAAQRKALAECRKRAPGLACRVALCLHSGGARARTLQSLARDPSLPPPTKPPAKTGFFAAIAYSPKTGKIGSSAGQGKTKEEAQALALKQCGAPDAKVYMWGDQWVAIAVAEGRSGVAGFGPGATRAVAEQAALAQCRKYGNGAPCRVTLVIHSSGKPDPAAAKPATAPVAGAPRPAAGAASPRADSAVQPAASAAQAPKTP